MPSVEFHRGRLQRLQDELTSHSLDGVLVLNPINTFYFSGFWYMPIGTMERPAALFVPAAGDPALIVSLDVRGHADGPLSPVVEREWIYREYPWAAGSPTLEWLCRRLEDEGFRGSTLGVEDNFHPVNDGVAASWYEQIRESFAGDTQRAGTLVNKMRMIKDDEEIALIRRACEYADELVRVTSDLIAVGRAEEEVGAEARATVEAHMRASETSLVPSLGTGQLTDGTPRGYHDTRSHDPKKGFQEGVPIIINCFATVGAYHAESERCGILGSATERQRELFDIAIASQQKAVEAVKAGVSCAEVDRVASEFISGRGHEVLYGVGHGIGLLGHEPPWVREGEPTILEAGMCITVEPGLAVRGEGSFHCSQTVLVTDHGCEPLTTTPEIHRLELG